jgi:predicted permease
MKERPPKLFSCLLQSVVQETNRESLAGDFEEVYHCRVEKRGVIPTLLWYLVQTGRLALFYLIQSSVWSVIMLRNYLKIAYRHLKKHAGYSILNITGLAVGMACCILFYLWVQDELSYNRFHTKAGRLYRVITHRDGAWTNSSPFSLGRVLKQDFPEIQKASRVMNRQLLTRYEDNVFYEQAALVDADFLEMFSFDLIQGDPNTALSTTETAVITESAARKYFENEDPVGKMITIGNDRVHSVTGVIADPPPNSSLRFSMLVPFRIAGEQVDQSWWLGSDLFVQLQENVELDDLRAKIAGTELKYDKRIESKQAINDLQPFLHMHLYGLNETGPVLYVYLFSLIALIVLIIACINFINLATARASNRAREVGLRKVVGAGRINIIRQFFGESLLMSLTAFFLALVIVLFALPHFNQLSGKQLSVHLIKNGSVIIGLLAIAAFTGIASGSYPALLLSSFKPITVLRESASSGAKNPLLRRVLVVFQYTVAIILIIGSITIQRQMNFIRSSDLGFDRENIIRIPMNTEIRSRYDGFKDALLRNPGILNVTAANNTPTHVGNINPFYWEGRGPDQYETFNFVTVDYDYFETFGMKMVEGRSFSREYATDSQNYIVNEALVNHTRLQPAVGKMLSIWTREGRIIGVVKDFHSRSLHNEIVPVAFLLTADWPHNYVFVRLNPHDLQASVDYIASVWKEFAAGYPFRYEYLDDVFEAQYRGDARIGDIFKNFTVLAVFISCLGLFGLASFMAAQRTREIGIRKVLGASVPRITGLLSREFLILLGIANLLAWPVAFFAMKRLMDSYVYRTNLVWWVFVAAGIAAVLISMLTVSYQAVRAARANPADAIKYE